MIKRSERIYTENLVKLRKDIDLFTELSPLNVSFQSKNVEGDSQVRIMALVEGA